LGCGLTGAASEAVETTAAAAPAMAMVLMFIARILLVSRSRFSRDGDAMSQTETASD
jgi:hypothetical protein